MAMANSLFLNGKRCRAKFVKAAKKEGNDQPPGNEGTKKITGKPL